MMRVAHYDGRKHSYEYIWKDIMLGVMRRGDSVLVDDDPGKGKRSGGLTREIQDLVVIIDNPALPTEGDIKKVTTKVGEKFIDNMLIEPGSFQYERLYKWNQLGVITKLINERKHTRKATFTLILPDDFNGGYVTCTLGGQFLVRGNNISLRVFMRSNDAFNAFPLNMMGYINLLYDVAKITNTVPYQYIHYVTSMHIYESDFELVEKMLRGD